MLGFKDKSSTQDLPQGPHQLLKQINYRWSSRQTNDNELCNRQLVINKILNGSFDDAEWLANQLAAYCKNKNAGSIRILSIQNADEIASGEYPMFFWTWRNYTEDIGNNIKIVFSPQGENDPMNYNIPILVNGQPNIWNKEKPFYDRIRNAIQTNSADRSVWNLACRLKELGFIEEAVLPEGRQKYPKNAIRMLQDYMGLDRTEYNEQIHRFIWKEFRISTDIS